MEKIQQTSSPNDKSLELYRVQDKYFQFFVFRKPYFIRVLEFP